MLQFKMKYELSKFPENANAGKGSSLQSMEMWFR